MFGKSCSEDVTLFLSFPLKNMLHALPESANCKLCYPESDLEFALLDCF